MREIPWRLIFLIALLIGAIFYRFPVEIQKFAIEAKDFSDKAIAKVQTLIGKGEKESLVVQERSAADKAKVVIVNLKNKRKIEGIITEEKKEDIMVDVGFGIIGISRDDIETIERPTDTEKKEIFEEWGKVEERTGGSDKTTEIRYWDRERIIVKALLNDKVKVTLILDTGAPYIVITPEIADRLLDVKKTVSKDVSMGWSDGSETKGKMILLDSVQVGSVEVKNVKAVISKVSVLDSGTDGLLGMSFLNYFHMKIDAVGKRIVLEKRG